jgi:hypothetical protein
MALTGTTPGGNPNGPDSAFVPLWVNAAKTDWLNNGANGELDGGYILVAQGENGDCGGLLVHVNKVESASYGAVGYEQSLAWVQATTGTVLREIHTVVGSHLPSTDVRRDGVGFHAQADVGTSNTGFLVHGNGGNWLYAFLAATSVTTGTDYFHVTGPSNPDGAGLVRVGNGSVTTPALTFVSQAGLGFYSNGAGVIGVAYNGASIADLGPAGVRIGSGLTDQGIGTLNVSGAYYIDDTIVIDQSRGIRLRAYTPTQLATATVP